MWFRNLSIFRLPKNWDMTAIKLAEHLSTQEFNAVSAAETTRSGWAYPRANGDLVYEVNGQWLMMLRTEKKLLPASVIAEATKARAAEIEEQQGFAPGRKALKDIKERVTEELLPRAFSVHTETQVWIDPINGWLVLDTSSATKSDDIIKMLLKSVGNFPVESLRAKMSPAVSMTEWLCADEAPSGFTIDQDAELRSMNEDKATVRYVHHTLNAEDVQRHIASGKQCKKLALTWADKISFVLTEHLGIRRIKALEILNEPAPPENETERFDADFLIMTAELAGLLDAIVESLGGESEQRDLVRDAATDPTAPPNIEIGSDDPLFPEAITIVQSHQRASISLIMRHLRIGYNRAARLLERMETEKIVGVMAPNGRREILVAA